MHLVFATENFYQEGCSSETGRYAYEMSRRLVERGHTVSVITRRQGESPKRETVNSIDVYRYELSVANHPGPVVLSESVAASRTVADFIAEIEEDDSPAVLVIHGEVSGLLVCKHIDDTVPRITTYHSPWPVRYHISTHQSRSGVRRWVNVKLRRYLERKLLERSTHAITQSEYMRSKLARQYDRPVCTTVIPSGVDAGRFCPSASGSSSITGGDPAILTIREFSDLGSLELLLDCFSSVQSEQTDPHLYVTGDGALRSEVRTRADRLGIRDDVTVLERVPHGERPGMYADADLCMVPTTELTGFGLPILEALAAGTPVVGTPVGGTGEILTGLAASLDLPAPTMATQVEADALAECLVAWGDLPNTRRRQAGAACRRYVRETYSWDRTIRELLALCSRVVTEDVTLDRRTDPIASR